MAKSVKFYSKANMDLWDYMSQRKFLCERTISIADDDNLGLVDFLKKRVC